MKGSRYLVFSIFFLAMIGMASPVLAVYTGTSFQGEPPDKIKKVVLALPGNKKTELVPREECEREQDDCDNAAAWFLKSDEKLAIGTTGTVLITDESGAVTEGKFEVTPTGISMSMPGPVVDEPAEKGPSVKLSVNYRNTRTGDNNAALGTVIRVGLGEFSIVSPRFEYSGEEYEIEADDLGGVSIGGSPWDISVRGWYFSPGSERKRGSVPVDTDGVGVTYPRMAPNASTGLFLGPSGADVRVEAEYMELGFAFGLSGGKRKVGSSGWNWNPTIGLQYDMREQEIDGLFTSPSFGASVNVMNDQELTDDFIGIPLGITFSRDDMKFVATQKRSIKVSIAALVTPGYQRSELNGYMRSMCTVCAPPEDNLYFSYNEDDSGFAWRAEVKTGLEIPVTDQLGISLNASYRFNSSISVAVNRRSPSYPVADLDDDEQHDWLVGLGARYSF